MQLYSSVQDSYWLIINNSSAWLVLWQSYLTCSSKVKLLLVVIHKSSSERPPFLSYSVTLNVPLEKGLLKKMALVSVSIKKIYINHCKTLTGKRLNSWFWDSDAFIVKKTLPEDSRQLLTHIVSASNIHRYLRR